MALAYLPLLPRTSTGSSIELWHAALGPTMTSSLFIKLPSLDSYGSVLPRVRLLPLERNLLLNIVVFYDFCLSYLVAYYGARHRIEEESCACARANREVELLPPRGLRK